MLAFPGEDLHSLEATSFWEIGGRECASANSVIIAGVVSIAKCIVIDRKHFINTDLSDLSTVGICDIFVYQVRHRAM